MARPSAAQPPAPGACAGRVVERLASSAVCSAGDTPNGAAKTGQLPATAEVSCTLLLPWRSTIGTLVAFAKRWSDTAKRPLQVLPAQAWAPPAAPSGVAKVALPGVPVVSNKVAISGKACNALPCQAAGSPVTVNVNTLPTTSDWLVPTSAVGAASRAASKSAPFSATEPFTGTCSTKLPSCGMHSWRHTSQLALSLISRSPLKPGANAEVIVSGTGNSTVPS